MSILTLTFRNKGNDILILTLGRGFRIFFFGLATYLAVILLMDAGSAGSNTGPVIFIVLSLLSGSYYEAVILDRKKRTITRHHGLLFLFKRRSVSFDEIESIRVDRFLKGRLQEGVPDLKPSSRNPFSTKATCKLSVSLNNGDVMDIEMLTERHYPKLKEKAERIAEFCSIPLGNAQ